jgi:hypothetical protein
MDPKKQQSISENTNKIAESKNNPKWAVIVNQSPERY